MTIAVPAQIERVVMEFDARTDPFEAADVNQALSPVASALGELPEAEHRGRLAEWAAFNFMPCHQRPDPWGTHFGPMFTYGTPDGGKIYQPDVRSIDAEIVEHWRSRGETLTNPLLRSRYAGLLQPTTTKAQINAGLSLWLDEKWGSRH